jgi:CRP-like cAMP-binding protein
MVGVSLMSSIPPRRGKAADTQRVYKSAVPRRRRLICAEWPRLFEGLSLSECAEIVSFAQDKLFWPKETIYGHDNVERIISLLVRGRVKTLRLSPLGSQVILRIEEAGDLIGELALPPGALDRLRVQAVERCQVLAWEVPTFDALCERFPKLLHNSMQILDERLRILEDRFLELATENADSRLAWTLIRLLDQNRSAARQSANISFSNHELGQMSGMSLFTVNRLLTSWQQCKIIQRQRKRVCVVDLASLMLLAGTKTSSRPPARATCTQSPSTVTSQLLA